MKERIVGAVVLVVVAVLVVPVFLDGPSSHTETLTEQVLLPGQSEQSRKQQTIVLERDRDQPVPAGGGAEPADPRVAEPAPRPALATAAVLSEPSAPAGEETASEVRSTPQPALQSDAKPEATPASTPDETPAAQARSATGMWAVQLGSFSEQANAERLAADLRSQGYAAFLSRLQTASNLLHRVRVGPQESRESAEKIAGQLERNGHKGQVVPHP